MNHAKVTITVNTTDGKSHTMSNVQSGLDDFLLTVQKQGYVRISDDESKLHRLVNTLHICSIIVSEEE